MNKRKKSELKRFERAKNKPSKKEIDLRKIASVSDFFNHLFKRDTEGVLRELSKKPLM